jgi:hypothetical protein
MANDERSKEEKPHRSDEIPEKFLVQFGAVQLNYYQMAKCAFILLLATILLIFSSTPQYAIFTGIACAACAYYYVKWDKEFSEWAKRRMEKKQSK